MNGSPCDSWTPTIATIDKISKPIIDSLLVTPMAKTRKKKPVGKRAIASRSKAKMFMPMDVDSVNRIAFRFRVALETARSGHATLETITTLIQTTLLTGYLADAGLCLIGRDQIDSIEKRLAEVLRDGKATGNWSVDVVTLDDLTALINEHDRQLRELRLQDIVNAFTRLDRLITKTAAY